MVIRTNSSNTSLTINAPIDKIKHYDKVGALNIIAIAPSSYHEYGEVEYAKIATGRLVVEETAVIDGIYLVANNSGDFENIKLAVVGNAKLPSLARADVALENGQSKLVVEVQTLQASDGTDANPEYVWITKTGTNVASVVSSSATSSTSVVARPSSAASTAKQTTENGATPVDNNSIARIAAVGYASLQLAIESAKEGDTITMIKDSYSTDGYQINKS